MQTSAPATLVFSRKKQSLPFKPLRHKGFPFAWDDYAIPLLRGMLLLPAENEKEHSHGTTSLFAFR